MKITIPHFPRFAARASLAATVIAAIVLILLWPLMPSPIAGPSAPLIVPLPIGLTVLVLLCSAALYALEFDQRTIAAVLAGSAAIAVTGTIATWVLNVAPPLNVFIFGATGADLTYFPTSVAKDAATPIAIASLAIVLLTFNIASSVMRPLGWAAGIMLIFAPVLRYLLALVTPVMELLELPQRAYPVNRSLIWIAIWLAVSLLGIALLSSRRTSSIADGSRTTTDWSARLRATVVVIVVFITLTLWHTLRAGEIRQLQEQAQTASVTVTSQWQKGIADRIRATDRLGQHWAHLGPNLSSPVFLADSQAFMRDYAGIHAIIVTDAQGRISKFARRDIPLGSAPAATDVAILVDSASPGFPLQTEAGGLTVAREAINAGARVRSNTAIVYNGISLLQSAAPIYDAAGQLTGAVLLVFRRDLNDAALLEGVAPDFSLRVTTNGHVTYTRHAQGDDVLSWPQPFVAAKVIHLNFSEYGFELAPGAKIVARGLTWTPALILLFAWAALILLSFALYNERRAYALALDRERILNESLDLICTLDAQGRYVTVNETSQQVLGYAAKDIIGRHIAELVHPGDQTLVSQQWLDAEAVTRPTTMPLRFIHKSGVVIYLQGNAHWSAKEQLFYCDMRDVSDQHALELARQQADSTFNTGVEQAGCVVYEYHYNTEAITWVGAIHALTGFAPEDLAASGFAGWMQAIHPDDRAHVQNTLQRCLESRQPHTIDYRLCRKDGEYVPVLDRGRHIENTAGSEPRMIGALIDLSAIRQQENALRRSEERYRIIATQVGAVIIERDIATGRVRIFGPVEQIYGYTKEQIESRPYGPDDTMIHVEDRARVNATVAAAEKTLSSYYVEYRRRHRGGHYIHIASRGVVLPGQDGLAERAVIAVTDITERKLAAERLQESDERFRLAAQQAGQIVYEFVLGEKLEVVELRFAGASEQVLGYSTADLHRLLTADRFGLIHPDDIQAARSVGGERLPSNAQFTIEHRLRHRDGHYVYVEDRGAVRRDEQRNITGIVGMLLDISERKRAEVERQAYTAQLGKLADIARKVSTLLSLHELLNYLARSVRELIGVNSAAVIVHDPALPMERVVAVSYTELYGKQRSEPTPFGSTELHALLTDDQPKHLTIAQIADDTRWTNLTQNDDHAHPLRGWLAVPLMTRDGSRLGLLELTDKTSGALDGEHSGEFTDSDAQVLSQLAGLASVAIENIRLYATLEERVAARTRELQNSNRELEAFSYSVSHDLRAPLRAIAGFSSILEQEYAPKLDAAARRYIQRVSSGVERMANLIDDLLSLARVSRLDIKRESIDLTSLCRAIVKRQLERWPDRELQIKVDPRMRVDADPRLVEVAMENLVENAIKFTGTRPQSEIHIGKRAVNGKPAFFVHDNGVGFDPQYATNLFGVFQRLHSASEFPGTGVGLATVHRILQRHNGRVWAESQIDQGATFYFTFDSEA
jgi:PAS domain S-box-containing protein